MRRVENIHLLIPWDIIDPVCTYAYNVPIFMKIHHSQDPNPDNVLYKYLGCDTIMCDILNTYSNSEIEHVYKQYKACVHYDAECIHTQTSCEMHICKTACSIESSVIKHILSGIHVIFCHIKKVKNLKSCRKMYPVLKIEKGKPT
jgi:hypothetical protein